MSSQHALTLAALRERDRATYDLLLESVGERCALAAMLVSQIAEHASTLALEQERCRVRAHFHVADSIGPHGLPVAVEAITSGACISETEARYQAAADSRRTTKLAVVPRPAEEGA